MGEVRFYKLDGEPLEAVLPILLERVLARGQRALVRVTGAEAAERLDAQLWTYGDGTFLPHGRATGGPQDAAQPVLLTEAAEAPNGAEVLFLTHGARFDGAEVSRFEMIVLLFEGQDPDAIAAAREDWKAVVASGTEAVFWAREGGKWLEKARSDKA